MIKSESNNTFGEGLMMDMNPLTTPNSVMTNCLNGTLITFNGNEYILQNDMGNGRVETAFLPEGFVPLGTTQLGGIIYIVSYNPNTNRCQIGSFPSPERNITSDETKNSPSVSLDNRDFGCSVYEKENEDGNKIKYTEGAKIYYLKKALNSNLIFNPGDKFIVYGDTIINNKDKIYGINEESLKDQTIRLYIGTITSDGKLVIFDDLKKFKIDDKNNYYYIYQYKQDPDSNENTPNLDEYRSLVSQPYNIFNSKISGELVVIAELIQCKSFEATVSHQFDINKKYIPDVTFTFNGDYEYKPYGVQCKFQLKGLMFAEAVKPDDLVKITNPGGTVTPGEPVKPGEIVIPEVEDEINETVEFKISEPIILTEPFKYEESVKNILNGTKIATALSKRYDFTKQQRSPLVLTYEFTPCMNWGPVKYLTVKGQIDLAKLGTGIVELNSWKYYNTEKKCNLTWGLDVYEEEGCEVSGVDFKLSRYVSTDKNEKGEIVYEKENLLYSIDKKTSYHGIFYETIPLDEEYYKLYKLDENNQKGKHGKLMPNSLYLVTIEVKYDRPEGQTNEVKKFYRWLYTNQCFNDYYYKEEDYNSLQPEFNTKIQFGYNTNASSSSDVKYGILSAKITGDSRTDSNNLDSKTSISVSQTVKEITADCTAKFRLEKDYNSFYLKLYDDGADLSVNTDEATLTVTSDPKYVDREDSNYKDFLRDNIIENWNGEVPNLHDPTVTPDELIFGKDSEGKDKYGNGLYITSPNPSITYNQATNTYSFDLSYKLLQLTKAYCTKKQTLLSYSGRFVPLCYDKESFADYNLVFEYDTTNKTGKWYPDIIGTFSFKEEQGNKGFAYIGSITKDNPETHTQTQYKKQEQLDINFGTDADIVYHENINGWKNTTMFVTHYGNGVNEPRQKWPNSIRKNYAWISNWNTQDEEWFSLDPKEHVSWNKSKHLVILMMQSAENDGNYYPLNFCMTSNIEGEPSNYFKSRYSKLYQTFAQVLNNIYKYEAKSFSQDYIIPDFIYYGDNYKYNVNIPITIAIKDTNKCIAEMKLEDKSLVPLLAFQGLIPEGAQVNSSNITAVINNTNDRLKLVIQDTNFSSLSLRNYIMDNQDINLGNIIYDFDGKTILGEQSGENYKPTELYCRVVTKSGSEITVQNIIEKASTFMPVQINYDSDGKAQSVQNGSGTKLLYQDRNGEDWTNGFGTSEDDSKQNLINEFMLSENGCLVIKDPDKIGLSFIRFGNDDDGVVTGYQRVGFGLLFKAWK